MLGAFLFGLLFQAVNATCTDLVHSSVGGTSSGAGRVANIPALNCSAGLSVSVKLHFNGGSRDWQTIFTAKSGSSTIAAVVFQGGLIWLSDQVITLPVELNSTRVESSRWLFSVDGVRRQMEVFVDGGRFDYIKLTSFNCSTVHDFAFGGTWPQYSNDTYFDGSIEDIRIWNRGTNWNDVEACT